jgi:hypothetical protein
MIPTNKSKLKHLRIEGTSRARKNDENSSKKTRKFNELQLYIHSKVRFFTNGGKI